ncbi:MAG: hypothetical protein R3E82_19230 [Pseudomonadales bacterium]|nr:hypothetical protein [Pseudomonadales bacterium]
MPADYHISADDGLITVQIDSDVDLAHLYEVAKQLLEDPDYDARLPLLLDLRNMRLNIVESARGPFNQFIIGNFGRNREASIAVVIDTELDEKCCADIYWLACAVGSAELFEEYDLALKWLIKREFAEPAAGLSR